MLKVLLMNDEEIRDLKERISQENMSMGYSWGRGWNAAQDQVKEMIQKEKEEAQKLLDQLPQYCEEANGPSCIGDCLLCQYGIEGFRWDIFNK